MFALLVFLLDKALAHWATQAVLHDVGEFGTLSVLYRGKVDSQIVLFGTSKTHVNIDAGAIEQQTGMSCYNLAISNATIETQELLFEDFLTRNKKPEIVFMEADFSQFRDSVTRQTAGGPIFRSDLLAPFSAISPNVAKCLNPSIMDQLAFGFFRCKNFSSGNEIVALLRSIFRYTLSFWGNGDSSNRTPQSGAAAGYQDNHQWRESRGAHLIAPLLEQPTKKRIDGWMSDDGKPGDSFTTALEHQNTYKRIVEMAKSEGIRLILYGPPLLGKLDENHAQEVDQFFSQLAERNEHVYYWSFRENHTLRSDATLWNDSIHMNWDGAEILTRKIIERLKNFQE